MRKILIDTHILLWWLADDNSLGPLSKQLMADPRNEVFVSGATSWEISIKKKKGLLQAPDDIDAIVEEEGFSKLAISLFHGEQAGSLEEIHRDSFDRMLVAQAQSEGLELLTVDGIIPKYGVRVIDAAR
jgi:PIN domain nuclease of toxin-antitoxin system